MKKFLPALVATFALYSCGGNPAYADGKDGIQIDASDVCEVAGMAGDNTCLTMIEDMLVEAVNRGATGDYPSTVNPDDTAQAFEYAIKQVNCTVPYTDGCKALVSDYAYWFQTGYRGAELDEEPDLSENKRMNTEDYTEGFDADILDYQQGDVLYDESESMYLPEVE